MKIISLYSGGGGIDLGSEQSGHQTVIAIDYEKAECETLKHNFPDTEVIHGQVKDYLKSLPKCDAVVGGPPCPEFSRANPNRSFDMCEVNNFWDAVEITKAKHYFMENVQDVRKKLIKKNYLIDVADYGLPQNRLRRIFTDLELPRSTHAENPQTNLFGENLKPWISIRNALKIEGLFIEDRKTVFGEYPNEKNGNSFRKYSIDKPSITIVADERLWLVEDLKKKNPVIFDKHKPQHIDGPASTIATKDRTSTEMITDGKYARKLRLDEIKILQGFPPEYIFKGNKGEQRRQIGNALPPQISKLFFQGIT